MISASSVTTNQSNGFSLQFFVVSVRDQNVHDNEGQGFMPALSNSWRPSKFESCSNFSVVLAVYLES
eukprot:688713-Hanusia_phi.AAC.6